MKVKTAELIGEALNWAVATIVGYSDLRVNPHKWDNGLLMTLPMSKYGIVYLTDISFSTDWNLAGPIIEREGIATGRTRNGKGYAAWIGYASDYGMVKFYTAHNLLTAAMRCYVASKLGDEVEIPDEMIKEK